MELSGELHTPTSLPPWKVSSDGCCVPALSKCFKEDNSFFFLPRITSKFVGSQGRSLLVTPTDILAHEKWGQYECYTA